MRRTRGKKEPKNSKNFYFTTEVENNIIAYSSLEGIEKQRVYNKIIFPALNKLVENIIHDRGLYEYGTETYSNTKMDCVTFLTTLIERYEPSRGSKAFSFFNRCGINFLVQNKQKIERNYKRSKRSELLSAVDAERNFDYEIADKEYKEDLTDFFQEWSTWGINNVEILFSLKREQKIAEAIFNIFKYSHSIDNYNKKALYIMIREQVNTKTTYITNVIRVLKTLQSEMYIEFKNSGTRKWKYFLIKEDDE